VRPRRFGQLRQVELDGVQPSPRGSEAGVASAEQLEARLRPDEPRSFPHAQELMDAASNREGPFFRIPKILEDTS
jgi:Asp-tRNA(Asn)/Glu-tRNA(Gln) amidotransferase C subunit